MDLALEPRTCPTCHVANFATAFPARLDLGKLDGFAFASRKLPEYMHHRLVECRSCSLLYADPAPAAGTLAELYHAAEFDSHEEAACASHTYGELLPAIVRRIPTAVSALDVGTGTGHFLEELVASGFTDVRGVEPSPAARNQAAPTVRDLIKLGTFDAASHAPESFDLISCFQTLEHLRDPATFCAEARSLLRPGGALYLVVHDRRAWSARLLKQRSPIFDLEHLQLFCRKSVKKLLRTVGYGDVTVHRLWNSYPLRYWARLLPLPPLLKRVAIGVLSLPGVRRLRLKIPAGNLAVIAYKQGPSPS